jgi:hypothetical protein
MKPMLGAIGRSAPHIDVHIVDLDGEDCPVGQVGEICIKTEYETRPVGICHSYNRSVEDTEAVYNGGFFHTGDTAYKDESGYIHYVGRNDDIIKSSGYRIGPFEIESVLIEHPAVLEVAVTGVPDPVRGFNVKATIVLQKGYEGSDELKRELKDSGFGGGVGNKPIKRIGELEKTCYVCERIEFNFNHMIETAVLLWQNDEGFVPKLKAQPYFCLPHYRRMLTYAQTRLPKKMIKEFVSQCESIQNAYIEELNEDVSWFCKKFDYRYNDEPWYNSKDSVERSMKFLRSDIHKQTK